MLDRPQGSTLFHGLWHGNELLANGARQTNGDVGKGFGTAGNDHVGMSSRDMLRTRTNCGIGRNTSLSHNTVERE
jgi:hypothetical protein